MIVAFIQYLIANEMTRTRGGLARHIHNFLITEGLLQQKKLLMLKEEIIDLKLVLFYCKTRMWMWK